MRKTILFANLLLVLLVMNYSVWEKETMLREDTVVRVRLQPVDPRSLMQGDYMRLNYEIPIELRTTAKNRGDGQFVITLDQNQVARFKRIYQSESKRGNNELKIDYQLKDGQISVGPDSYFFQEGRADHFQTAEYAEFRVSDSGAVLLTNLLDENFNPLDSTTEPTSPTEQP